MGTQCLRELVGSVSYDHGCKIVGDLSVPLNSANQKTQLPLVSESFILAVVASVVPMVVVVGSGKVVGDGKLNGVLI